VAGGRERRCSCLCLSRVRATVLIAPLRGACETQTATVGLRVGQAVILDAGRITPAHVGAEVRVSLADPDTSETLFYGATQTIDVTE